MRFKWVGSEKGKDAAVMFFLCMRKFGNLPPYTCRDIALSAFSRRVRLTEIPTCLDCSYEHLEKYTDIGPKIKSLYENLLLFPPLSLRSFKAGWKEEPIREVLQFVHSPCLFVRLFLRLLYNLCHDLDKHYDPTREPFYLDHLEVVIENLSYLNKCQKQISNIPPELIEKWVLSSIYFAILRNATILESDSANFILFHVDYCSKYKGRIYADGTITRKIIEGEALDADEMQRWAISDLRTSTLFLCMLFTDTGQGYLQGYLAEAEAEVEAEAEAEAEPGVSEPPRSRPRLGS